MSPGLLTGVLLLGVGAPPEAAADSPAPGMSAARREALARYGAGLWQVRRDRLLSAAKSLEAAARQDPDAATPLKELVRVYTLLGREPDAIRVARTALEKDPRDAATAHALARLLYDAGELTEAVAVAKVAAENVDAEEYPDKALAVYRDLATLLDKTDDPAGAAAALKQAVELLTDRRKAVIASGAFTAKEVDAEAADTFERLGRVLVKAGKAKDAAEAFHTAHKLFADPKKANDPGAAARLDWNLSAAYAAANNPAAALNHLEAFLKLRPQAVEPYERLAALLHQAGRGEEAAPALQRYATRDPENLSLAAVLAAELARDPDTRRQADAGFAKVLAATNDPKIVRVVIRSHVETRRPGRVLAALDEAYQQLKDDDEPLPDRKRAFAAERARVVAEILRGERDWTIAVIRAGADELRAGTKRAYQTWHALGLLAARHGKLDIAEVQLRYALQTAPVETQFDVYQRLIDVLWRGRKSAAIATDCRDGLRRDDLNRAFPLFRAYLNKHLALALADLGRGDEAVAAADKAIAQAADADRLGFRLAKVDVLQVVGRYDEATAAGKKLLDEFHTPADRTRIRYHLSIAYWGAKKYPEAEAELRAILDADPDHTAACNDLGFRLADQGRNLDEAERLVRHAVAVDRADRRKAGDPEPESAAYLDSLAWVLFRRGKLAEARGLLEKVSKMPDGAADPVVWDHLGDVRFRQGEKEKAKLAWEEAARLLADDARGKRDGRFDEVRRKLRRVP